VRIPGDIRTPAAGPILRRGAPVLLTMNRPVLPGDDPAEEFTTRGIVYVSEETPAGTSWIGWYEDARIGRGRYFDGSLDLDFADDLGMDIAARWLARHHGLTVGATAPGWTRKSANGIIIWVLTASGASWMFWTELAECYIREATYVQAGHATAIPGISALTDPAEALRLAVLNAAGRAP
jgi:hypothetical protein